MLRGAELSRHAVRDVQVGLPRIGFVRRRAAPGWQGKAWAGGVLDPAREIDRIEIDVPEPGAEAEPAAVVPPTPEEAYPAPLRYHLSFPDGPSLEIRPLDADGEAGWLRRAAAGWVNYWHDLAAALFTPRDERLRLRIVLSPEDAGTLYRALPPNVSLLVVRPH
jgi:hypothetical protein